MKPEILSDVLNLPGTTTVISGRNFSGRSAMIRSLKAEASGKPVAFSNACGGIVVTPEVHLAISARRFSVLAEVIHHLHRSEEKVHALTLLEIAGLASCAERNPTTLSGGEQSALAFVCKLFRRPRFLGLDCSLEQIRPQLKDSLISAMRGMPVFADVQVAITDNRLSESSLIVDSKWEVTDQEKAPTASPKGLPLKQIDPEADLPTADRPHNQLTLSDLTFGYTRGSPIIKSLSATFSSNQIHVVSGANGAGKSTLSKLLCGLNRPWSGTINFNDSPHTPYLHPGRLVTYNYQDPDAGFFTRTVGDEIAAGPASRGQKGLEKHVSVVMTALGLQHLSNIDVYDLPYVLRKRVGIAATIATGAPWMIFDEPTLGQDDISCSALATIFRRLSSNGFGVIVISHSRTFVTLLNAREHTLSDGRVHTPLPQ